MAIEQKDHWSRVGQRFEKSDPEEVLGWAAETFGNTFALACSFGAEDMVLVHMLSRVAPGSRVFYLDTELLFPETYRLRDTVVAKFPVRLERVQPALSLACQEEEHGPALWERAPDLCCGIRKVQPLRNILADLSAWVTGIRRDQTPERAQAPIVGWDDHFGLVKINPLATWTWADVWQYIARHQVPHNPLHHQGYPSIGCWPCTAAVTAGEDPRSGRWQGQGKRECGLHAPTGDG